MCWPAKLRMPVDLAQQLALGDVLALRDDLQAEEGAPKFVKVGDTIVRDFVFYSTGWKPVRIKHAIPNRPDKALLFL